MTPVLWAAAVALATIAGGLLPLYTKLKEIEFRYLVGFAAGVMLSTAFFEIIPDVGEFNEMSTFFLAFGFFLLYLVEKSILIHSCGESECEVHTPIGWVSVVGIGAESLVDGIAIAVGFSQSPALGTSIALAVLIHEIPRGFSTTVIMRHSGYNRGRIFTALGIDSFLTPLGALIGLSFPPEFFGPVIAFTAGTFIYVGAADLLPDAHRRFNSKVVASVLLGAAVIPLVVELVGSGH